MTIKPIMIIKRILANFVDIFVFFALLVGMFLFAYEYVSVMFGSYIAAAWITLAIITAANFALQYLFLTTHQTIGKAFFRLKIISTDPRRPLTVPIIIQRELFGKIMTCYLLCLPSLFGREGKHEEMSDTKVVDRAV